MSVEAVHCVQREVCGEARLCRWDLKTHVEAKQLFLTENGNLPKSDAISWRSLHGSRFFMQKNNCLSLVFVSSLVIN